MRIQKSKLSNQCPFYHPVPLNSNENESLVGEQYAGAGRRPWCVSEREAVCLGRKASLRWKLLVVMEFSS